MDAPNILLFLTDDHGAWALGCNGNREVRTPHLDHLARQGARFANAFTPCPVCSPARACLMTGRTPSQVGIHDWLQEAVPEINDHLWLQDEIALPALLARAGYFCGLSGKWHLGRADRAPGFDWHFALRGHQGGHIEEYTYIYNNQEVTISGNKTGIITDYALDFLDETPPHKPFFLNVGYIATHSPYLGQEAELVALYDDANFDDIPPHLPHPWRKNEWLQGEPSREALCPYFANYYAAVTDMDQNVGRILGRLEEQGRLDETLVIYLSDHGCTLGHHGFWGKGNSTRPLNLHETSLRVPLILRWPAKIPAGKVVENCVDHYDAFQAICGWAGVELDSMRNYPGRNFAPLLDNENVVNWREARFGEYGDTRMIRTPAWKLVRRYPNGPDDLFDLQNDPDELQNLAAEPEFATIRAELLQHLETWYANFEDPNKSGLRAKFLPRHNDFEAWRDGIREARGLQIY